MSPEDYDKFLKPEEVALVNGWDEANVIKLLNELARGRERIAQLTADLVEARREVERLTSENKRVLDLGQDSNAAAIRALALTLKAQGEAKELREEVERLKADNHNVVMLLRRAVVKLPPSSLVLKINDYLSRKQLHGGILRDAALPAAATCSACVGGHTENGFQDCEKCGGTGNA